ncbi:MAG: hypothetical protein HEQ35_02115 [Gloeotrichia echinulata IR180]
MVDSAGLVNANGYSRHQLLITYDFLYQIPNVYGSHITQNNFSYCLLVIQSANFI